MRKSSITASVDSIDLSSPGRIVVRFKLTRWEEGSAHHKVIGGVVIDHDVGRPVRPSDYGPAVEAVKEILAGDLSAAADTLREEP